MGKSFSIFDCNVLHLPKIQSRSGNITPIQNFIDVPFEIKRVYYLYDIPSGESRGAHAHKSLQQLIIAASGSFDVTIDDGKMKKTVSLSRPNYGLHLQPGIWRDLSNFSSGSVCLVIASLPYDEADYIRNYNSFMKFKNETSFI